MGVEDFHFLRPWWLLGVPPLLWLAWYWVKRTRGGSGWESAIDNQLLSVLLDSASTRVTHWLRWLLLGALTLSLLGLAGPTWQKLPQNVEQKNDALIILLDLSLSMLAEDVKPSRVERARQKIIDILRLRDEGQTALVVYAGDAHAVVPLTDDSATIENLLVALSPEMMPVFGSNPDHALQLAHELMENALIQQGRIVMITDGIDDISDVSRHRSRAYPISVIGVGSAEGGPIPLDRLRQNGRFLQTQEGNQVIALLDESRLREVAELTFGQYATLGLGDRDIELALGTVLPGEDDSVEVAREFDTWFDQGHWAALLLMPLMLLGFRRGGLYVCVMTLWLPADHAHAGVVSDVWDSLWQRDDQRALTALRQGSPERAATLFDDPQWQSVAQYRSGDYNSALNGFAADPSIDGAYNRGNALARLGQYEAAISQYDQALSRDPAHEDAAFNKQLVEQLLEQQQQDQQQQDQDQQNQGNNEDNQSQQDQQNQEQETSEQEQPSDQSEQEENQSEQQEQQQPQQGEQQQAQAEQDERTRDEKQDALEQWLRRVPDDPGGLLRRKFSHETKQRLRRGDYDNRQGEKIW